MVLSEQDLQEHEGYKDPEYTASLYHEATASSVAKARAIGLRDELEAFSLYKES